MRKLLLAIFLATILIPKPVSAAEIQLSESFSLEKGTIIMDNLIVSAGKISIAGQINGDLIAAGGEIDIWGEIKGDLIAAGGKVHLHSESTVGKHARLIGGEIISEGKINKDLNGFGGSIKVSGPVDGDIRIEGGKFELNNSVKGSVKADAENTILGGNTHIYGALKAPDQSSVIQHNGAKIDGPRITLDKKHESIYFNTKYWLNLIIQIIAYWLIGLLFIYLFARLVQKNSDYLSQHFWLSLGIGLISIITAMLATIILAVTIIGLPLGLILLTITLMLIYLGQLPIAFYLTQKLLGKRIDEEHNRYLGALYLLISISAISLVGTIPFLGGIVKVLLTFAGIGTVLVQKRTLYQALREKEIV
ncbi:MAG: hypothetical protein HY817_02815 [Candidatus Abawacabacteria bacterium]|nr:hypothetical protein [Candidatus Abawacabacteria bacterium]